MTAAGSDSGQAGSHPPPYSIVIIDDEQDMRELIALRLGMVPGLSVVGQGSSGDTAIALAKEHRPDLMTIDLMMPLRGGAAAIPLLRAVAPLMKIVVYSSDPKAEDLTKGRRPDGIQAKGGNLRDLVSTIQALLAEAPKDTVEVDLGRMPVEQAVDAFDSWVGLNARVRRAMATNYDDTSELLGDLPLDSADLLCLMGVFMQFGHPLMTASAAGEQMVDMRFTVRRDAGAAARRALLALGGNGTLRAFNRAWSHSPSKESERALDLVDSRLVDQLPAS